MIYEDVFNYSQPAGEPCMYVIIFWQSLLQTSLATPIIYYVAVLTQAELQPSRILSFSLQRICTF